MNDSHLNDPDRLRRPQTDLQSLGEGLPTPTGEKASVTCQECGEEFVPMLLRDRCPDCRRKKREEDEVAVREETMRFQDSTRRRWLVECGIPRKFSTATFETWTPRAGSIEVAADACRVYAEAFPIDGYNSHGWHSLGLSSDGNGLGKTFLVAAIANRLIQRWAGVPGEPCPVMYQTGTGLLRRIRGSYNLASGSTHETEEEIYFGLRGVKLLILDDVGKVVASDHTRRVFYEIIEDRYSTELPLIMVSNMMGPYLENLIGTAAYDRFYEMCEGGHAHTLDGKSYRGLMMDRER